MTTPPKRLAELARLNHGTARGWLRHLLGVVELQTGRLQRFQIGDPARAQRLVFVCLGNINRSAFACAVANKLGEPSISIGLSTTTGAPATHQAMEAAVCHTVDLSCHRATAWEDYAYRDGDLLLVMEVRHARTLAALGIPTSAISFLGLWGAPARIHLHDPHTLSPEYFETCFSLIETAVRRLIAARRATSL